MLNQAPESLERVLRVVRHRGFKIQTMNVEQKNAEQFSIQLHLHGHRPITQLNNQLTKLIDVIDCQTISKPDKHYSAQA